MWWLAIPFCGNPVDYVEYALGLAKPCYSLLWESVLLGLVVCVVGVRSLLCFVVCGTVWNAFKPAGLHCRFPFPSMRVMVGFNPRSTTA